MLWLGLLLPPVAWSAVFEAVYLANEYACAGYATAWSHIASLFGLVLCGVGGTLAYLNLPNSGRKSAVEPVATQRFMPGLGITSAVFFGLVVIATWMPMITGVPCSK